MIDCNGKSLVPYTFYGDRVFPRISTGINEHMNMFIPRMVVLGNGTKNLVLFPGSYAKTTWIYSGVCDNSGTNTLYAGLGTDNKFFKQGEDSFYKADYNNNRIFFQPNKWRNDKQRLSGNSILDAGVIAVNAADANCAAGIQINRNYLASNGFTKLTIYLVYYKAQLSGTGSQVSLMYAVPNGSTWSSDVTASTITKEGGIIGTTLNIAAGQQTMRYWPRFTCSTSDITTGVGGFMFSVTAE